MTAHPLVVACTTVRALGWSVRWSAFRLRLVATRGAVSVCAPTPAALLAEVQRQPQGPDVRTHEVVGPGVREGAEAVRIPTVLSTRPAAYSGEGCGACGAMSVVDGRCLGCGEVMA